MIKLIIIMIIVMLIMIKCGHIIVMMYSVRLKYALTMYRIVNCNN